ncbi:Long-chain-fatty-acid--CoA ligase 1 [Yarrowia sp. C11]|nr:Long-chain-fatty-acid--CoA ligase 1 [Yarrowia sp. E02]KAG5367573.1 Long-chain-fatty-acid--CoA ligase 1 [Yarrowia sp. C11]
MVGYSISSKPVSVEVGPARPGETAPRRNVIAKDAPIVFPDNDSSLTSVYKLFKKYAEINSDRKAMGWRDTIDIHVETKQVTKVIDGVEQKVPKEWKYFELGPYKWLSYKEALKLVHDYGAGLRHLGIEPQEKMHIYAQTSHRWMLSGLASLSQGIPIVTAYDTLGEEGLTRSLQETNSVIMFTDKALLGSLKVSLKKGTDLRIIIHGGDLTPDDKAAGTTEIDAIKEIVPEIKIYTMDEVVALGREHPHPVEEVDYEDLAFIMYTSGSTGVPKGVVLQHKQILASVAGVTKIIDRSLINHNDRLLNFLPLAHIFEFVFEMVTFWWGASLGYGTVKTISDLSMKNCKGDIRELKPTIMVGVPAVWEPMRKGILGKIKELSPIMQKVFWASYATKQRLDQNGLPGGSILDSLIFKKVKDATGGCLRYVCNGGAPVSVDTQKFITTLICPMLIGCGLTETTANTTIMSPRSYAFGTIGEPTAAVTLKLIDVPEAGYFAENNQGELCIKGGVVMKEYYKNEAETKKAFSDDGYFLTGDIAEWTANGQLRIIDRRKNLVKTQNGEYIALEKLETQYRSSSYVANLCVYADQNRVKPIALVIPNEGPTKKLAESLGVDGDDWESLCANKKVIKAVLKDMLDTGRSLGLSGIELLQGIVLLPGEWTPQNNYLTAAQKLNRKKIVDDNKKEIDACYEQS